MPNTPTTTSSNFYLTYIKLRFFTKVRRFLQPKAKSKEQFKPSDQPGIDSELLIVIEEGEKGIMGKEVDKDSGWMVLQKSVKKLHFGSWDEKEVAAEEIKRLAKEDLKRRKLMAELGVIPPLVAMVGGSEAVLRRQRLAVQTLTELGNGSLTNKALMVEAGILSKLPQKTDNVDGNTRQEFAELILSISSLANTQYNMDSSRIIPFAVSILDSSNSSVETKCTCLGTLYNISSVLENSASLATNGTVTTLLRLSSSLKEVSEKALATLGNLVVTLMGKKAMEENPMVPQSLIEIMTWEEKPKCQELSVYILMILAHQSSVQREKMAKAGIVPVLLEVALLSSSLAQKRALKLLQWFKDGRYGRLWRSKSVSFTPLQNNTPGKACSRDSQCGRRKGPQCLPISTPF